MECPPAVKSPNCGMKQTKSMYYSVQCIIFVCINELKLTKNLHNSRHSSSANRAYSDHPNDRRMWSFRCDLLENERDDRDAMKLYMRFARYIIVCVCRSWEEGATACK